jgi:hypothetical protein
MSGPIDVGALAAEVADGNFSDERLNKRLKLLVLGLSKDSTRSLPRSFDSAGLEAAYRFFSNHRVTPTEILAGHFAATRRRCEQEETVLVAHDSTDFSYRLDGEREGLGRVHRGNENSCQTFFAHFSLAMSADGSRRPLGVAGFRTWVRGDAPTGIEYQRWEEQIRAVSKQVNGLANVIHLADREADDYEMFYALVRDGHRFVVRCQHNRLLDEASGEGKLHGLFSKVLPAVEREVPISRRRKKNSKTGHGPREARLTQLSVAAATVVLKKPKSPRRHGLPDAPPNLSINVVRVWEAAPPDNVEPIEWYLYTTEPVETADQQLAIVDYYRARWTIEEYNKALKTGCAFESRQLQDYEGLVNLLAVFVPIAYRLLLIRSEAARAPDQPALNVVSKDEIDVLRALGRRKLPDAPTARDVYLAIAALGGHIKYAPDPGWLTLARGYQELKSLVTGWTAAKLQQASDQR